MSNKDEAPKKANEKQKAEGSRRVVQDEVKPYEGNKSTINLQSEQQNQSSKPSPLAGKSKKVSINVAADDHHTQIAKAPTNTEVSRNPVQTGSGASSHERYAQIEAQVRAHAQAIDAYRERQRQAQLQNERRGNPMPGMNVAPYLCHPPGAMISGAYQRVSHQQLTYQGHFINQPSYGQPPYGLPPNPYSTAANNNRAFVVPHPYNHQNEVIHRQPMQANVNNNTGTAAVVRLMKMRGKKDNTIEQRYAVIRLFANDTAVLLEDRICRELLGCPPTRFELSIQVVWQDLPDVNLFRPAATMLTGMGNAELFTIMKAMVERRMKDHIRVEYRDPREKLKERKRAREAREARREDDEDDEVEEDPFVAKDGNMSQVHEHKRVKVEDE